MVQLGHGFPRAREWPERLVHETGFTGFQDSCPDSCLSCQSCLFAPLRPLRLCGSKRKLGMILVKIAFVGVNPENGVMCVSASIHGEMGKFVYGLQFTVSGYNRKP